MQKVKLQFKIQNLINPFIIIGIAVVLRLIPHPANVAPIAAMALFGGAYLDKRYAILVPLVAMVISDIFLGFHDTILFVYGSFLITGFIGVWLKKHKSITNILFASLVSSLLFFLITNFGVWLVGNIYPKTITGLLECFLAAIPFFKNTILGDFIYTSLFFGGYEVVLRWVKNTATLKQRA